jgi:superfamily II DNA or RNA helicase
MNVEVLIRDRGAFSAVRGSSSDIDQFEDMLLRWTRQLCPHGRAMKVSRRPTRGELFVLTGALLEVLKDWHWEPGPGCEEASRLGAVGLRDYQIAAVQAAWKAPHLRSLLELPPGAGKTHIAAALIATGAAMGLGSWAYLVTNVSLADQTQQKFNGLVPKMLEALGGADVEYCCSSYGIVDEAALTAADGLIVDEVHQVAAPTRSSVVAKATRAVFKCGLSATPLLRQDAGNAMVIGLFGPVRYRVEPAQLQAAGVLSKGHFHVVCL